MRITNRQLFLVWTLIAVLIALAASVKAQSEFCCFWTAQGRVTDIYGRPVSATVTMWGCSTPECTDWKPWSTRTNTFGYFQIVEIPAQDYALEIWSRRGYYTTIVGPTQTKFIEVVLK